MASSSGSFRASPRPGLDPRRRRLGWLAGLVLSALAAVGAPVPDYVRTALARFSPNPPAGGWSYTLATTRNGSRMTERYDPTKPPDGRWDLLELDGRTPTPAELEKYARSRPRGEAGGVQANFGRNDIEPGSLRLLRETDTESEWSADFREVAAGADKMLGHLALRLTIDKRTWHVAAYAFDLKEAYSPVLGVKMTRLHAETRYHAPVEGRPALPVVQTSSFTGRLLFIPTHEELELRFTDYAPVPTKLSR